jgi:hypothetical protein
MNLTDKIQEINRLCNFEWSLEVNTHKSFHSSIEDHNFPHFNSGNDTIPIELQKEILNKEICVCLSLYPSNSVGCYFVYHYDLDKALDKALKILSNESI